MRRWCTHHRATRLATLTFAEEPEDLDAGWLKIDGFRRRLREAGIPEPAIVPEYGSQNGRLHFHAALPSYVPKDQLRELWGQGFVDIRRLRSRKQPRAGKVGGRAQARMVASYVAGYIAKGGLEASASGHPKIALNRRRYSIPKNSSPEPVRFSCWTMFDAWAEIQAQCGHQVAQVWASPIDGEWRGPPTLLLMG